MATKRKPTAAQIAARERFAAMARAGKFKRKAGTKAKPRAKNPARKRNPSPGDDAFTLSVVKAGKRQWLVGIEAGSRRMTFGPFSRAVYMTAARAAINKAKLENTGHTVTVHPVETIDFAESTPGKLSENPSRRKRNPGTTGKTMRARMTRANPSARKVTHVELRSKPGALPLWHFEASEHAGVFKSFKLPATLAKSKDFQAWARGMNYVLSATHSQMLAKLRRFT